MAKDARYWESLYNNRLAFPDHPQFFARWAEESEKARTDLRCDLDVPFGPHPMERMDIFRPRGASRAFLLFIHGGYWRALDKRDHSFVAFEPVGQGITVGVANYALCPSVTVEEIVRQMLRACAWAYRNAENFGAPRDRLYVSGHSAGGHLTAMMMAARWPSFARDLPRNLVRGGLAISGVYDLRDVVNVPSINNDVRLTRAQALKVSPIFYPPATDAPLYTAVGGKELPPFVEQNKAFGAKWRRVLAADIPCPDDHHFSILERLREPSHALFKGAMEMMSRRSGETSLGLGLVA
jgi:arylformamidase